MANEVGTSYLLFVDPETFLPVGATVTIAGDTPSTWTWAFSDYGADITIEQPAPRTPTPTP
jgi:hypothetical protein